MYIFPRGKKHTWDIQHNTQPDAGVAQYIDRNPVGKGDDHSSGGENYQA